METSSVHHQAMATHLDEALNCPKSQQQQQNQQHQDQKKARPQPEQALKCPRCNSTNTKFCYYNNYSLSQPRYFCKGCRRYWTKGGSLRNVPVGGGCRKNHKRSSNSSSSSSSNSSSSKKSNDLDLAVAVPNPTPLLPPLPLPPLSFDPADLTLAFASDSFMLSNTTPAGTGASVSGFLDILRGGGGGGGGGNNLSSYYGFGGIDRNMDQIESGAVANTNAGTTVDAGAGLMMFPNFDGGLLNGTASGSSACTESVTATTEMDHSGAVNVDVEGENSNSNSNKVVMGMGLHQHQWPVVDYGNLGLDSARDAHYWNGVGAAAAAPWHGLINSSLM